MLISHFGIFFGRLIQLATMVKTFVSALLVAPALAFTIPHAPTSLQHAYAAAAGRSRLQMSATQASSAEMAHAREVFQAFDADNSGTIGSQELGDMLSALDIDASDEETAALFRYLDSDGSGGVSFEQFEPWYSEAADAAKQSAEVFQGIIMSRRTVDSFDKTEVDQAVIRRAIECAIAAPVSTTSNSFLAVCPTIVSIAISTS